MTNYERIKNMTLEEMKIFLREWELGFDYSKTHCSLCCKDAALERRSVNCIEECLKWWLENDTMHPQGLDYVDWK